METGGAPVVSAKSCWRSRREHLGDCSGKGGKVGSMYSRVMFSGAAGGAGCGKPSADENMMRRLITGK